MSTAGAYANSDANRDFYTNADCDGDAAAMREHILADLQRHVPRRPAVLRGWAVCALSVRRSSASAVRVDHEQPVPDWDVPAWP